LSRQPANPLVRELSVPMEGVPDAYLLVKLTLHMCHTT